MVGVRKTRSSKYRGFGGKESGKTEINEFEAVFLGLTCNEKRRMPGSTRGNPWIARFKSLCEVTMGYTPIRWHLTATSALPEGGSNRWPSFGGSLRFRGRPSLKKMPSRAMRKDSHCDGKMSWRYNWDIVLMHLILLHTPTVISVMLGRYWPLIRYSLS